MANRLRASARTLEVYPRTAKQQKQATLPIITSAKKACEKRSCFHQPTLNTSSLANLLLSQARNPIQNP